MSKNKKNTSRKNRKGQQWEPLDLDEIKRERQRLAGRTAFSPMLPADAAASALDALADWPEQWLSLTERQQPKVHAFSAELEAFKEQTLFIAKHCEKQGMDASALVQYARELQRTYSTFRPDLPKAGDDLWVLLDRLKLHLEPFEQGGGGGKHKRPIPHAEANVLVRDHLKARPNDTAKQTAKAVGIAQGRLPGLAAWQAVMNRRNDEKLQRQPKGKQERRLTDAMLNAVSNGDDPALIAEAKEIAWRKILETATPEQKSEYHVKSNAEQDELIKLYLDQRQDADAQEGCERTN